MNRSNSLNLYPVKNEKSLSPIQYKEFNESLMEGSIIQNETKFDCLHSFCGWNRNGFFCFDFLDEILRDEFRINLCNGFMSFHQVIKLTKKIKKMMRMMDRLLLDQIISKEHERKLDEFLAFLQECSNKRFGLWKSN